MPAPAARKIICPLVVKLFGSVRLALAVIVDPTPAAVEVYKPVPKALLEVQAIVEAAVAENVPPE
jgi:hypothetical protein